MIPQSFIEEVNSRVDIAAFIGERVPDLKKAGHDYKACCPFHSETSPSFTVSPAKGFYHCFGCGVNGNAVKFVMEHEGKGFIEALKDVAAYVGMELPKDDNRPKKTKEERQEAVRAIKARDALSDAQSIYATLLQGSNDAQSYLATRGVTEQSILKFGLGYAPDAWNTITGKKQFTKEVLEDAGLSTKSTKIGSTHAYDRFRDRIMFPIYGSKDTPIGFGGRAIHEQDPKYLNSPECLVFHKGNNLYGVKQSVVSIRQNKRAFVVEGYMDVVMVSQYGIENVVASLGTSITEGQMRKLFNIASHITFCMDGDEPGRVAAWRAAENILPLLDDTHCVDFMFMPDDIDPDDYVRAHGKDAFDNLALQARTLTDFVLDEFLKSTDMNNGESLAKYLSRSNEMAEQIKSGVVKLSFQKRIAGLAGISLDTMLDMLKNQKAAAKPVEQPAVQPAAVEPQRSQPYVIAMAPPHAAPEISIAAKMLGIAALHTREVAERLNTDFLSRFLSAADKEMLFPLLAYLKANPATNGESVVASLSFNPHVTLIAALVNSAGLLGNVFDARAETKQILERFKTMERVWAIVLESQKKAAAA